MFANCSFVSPKNKLIVAEEKFCKDLREHAMKIINYEKKK